MNQIEAEHFVKKLFFNIWEGNDLNQFSNYYHPNIQTDLGGKVISYDEINSHAVKMHQEWRNIKILFKDIISNGQNKIAVRFNMSGIKDEESVEFEMMGIYELKDNKLYKIFGLSNPPMVYPKNG